jgi:signal peptidase
VIATPLQPRRARGTRTRTILRSAAGATVWAAGGFAATLLLALTALAPLGIHSYVVRSNSMRPAIETGDIVIDRTIHPTAARIGDTITFRDPHQPDRTITHRVRTIRRHGNTISFTTMGIANNTTQQWSVPANGRIGRVTWRVPKLGWLLAPVRTTAGLILMVVVPTLGLALLALRNIWTVEVLTP